MLVEPYSNEMEEEWDSFVWRSASGTIFHTRRFLSYHPSERFRDSSLVFREKNIIALFPAVDLDGVLYSHRGASYGGFVYMDNLSIKNSFKLIESLIDYAKNHGFRHIEMTLPPLIYLQRPNNYLDFVMMKKGFKYRKRELTAYIPITDDPFSLFKQEARTATRKAMKEGLKAQLSDDFSSFYRILKKNLRMRHNVKPTHTLDELLKLKSLFPDRIWLNAVYHKDRMIAGTVIFETNQRVALAFYISHDDNFQEYRPVNFLFYDTLKKCREKGFQYIDLGTFTLNMEPNMGLGRFKESLGARGLFRDTLYIDL